jgi:hypothetical protein
MRFLLLRDPSRLPRRGGSAWSELCLSVKLSREFLGEL